MFSRYLFSLFGSLTCIRDLCFGLFDMLGKLRTIFSPWLLLPKFRSIFSLVSVFILTYILFTIVTPQSIFASLFIILSLLFLSKFLLKLLNHLGNSR